MEKNKIQLNSSITLGKEAPTALNVLIGSNNEKQSVIELQKLDYLNSSDLPISFLTDLSLFNAKKGDELWRRVIAETRFLAGTVPVYQMVRSNRTIDSLELIEFIQEQAEAGVKLITIHPTPSYELIEMSRTRRVPITSRGGSAICLDMIITKRKENIYKQVLDDIIRIANKNEFILSIGSSFRSANIYDAMDIVYQNELLIQMEIAAYCCKHGVNTIIETPGHASPQDIFKICSELNSICPYPIMPLGPMPIDCAFEQDDVAAVIGAVLMGTRGCADILTVVTREEHTGGIPTFESLLDAVKKYIVAKHIIDVYKLGDVEKDEQVSLERSRRASCIFNEQKHCDRCGELCPLNLEAFLKSN